MAQHSGFFNAQLVGTDYDRKYDASEFAKYFANFIDNGVYNNPTNQLKVVAKSGLNVTVRKGKAFINGFWYELDEDMDLSISPNTSSYTTYAKVCCGLNKSNRTITLYVENSATNLKPTNSENVVQLVLATIAVGVGVTSISDSNITDRRPDKAYCGFVSGVLDQIDETELFKQYDSMFTDWFDTIKNVLSSNTAGDLLNKYTELKAQVDALPTIRSGTANPSDSVGKDGDIYIKILS